MSTPEARGLATDRIAAPDCSIFLESDFRIDPQISLDPTILDELQDDARLAKAELLELRSDYGQDALDKALTRLYNTHANPLRAGVDAIDLGDDNRPPQLMSFAAAALAAHNLLERIDKPGIFKSLVAYEAERLAELMVARLELGQTAIGDTVYEVGEGAWDRRWLTTDGTDAGSDGERVVFGRYDLISDAENLRYAKFDDHLRLVRDITNVRERAGVSDGSAAEPVTIRKPFLAARAGKKDELTYPFISHSAHLESLKFYETYEDLFAEGMGEVVRFVWDGDSIHCPETLGARDVTVIFDARKYVEAQDRRINSAGLYFDGPGEFQWQVIEETSEGKIVSSIQLIGALIRQSPVYRYDRSGNLEGVYDAGEEGIRNSWELIRAGLASDELRERVEAMRNSETSAVTRMVAKGQRRPKKTQIASGFSGQLVELPSRAQSDILQLKVSRFIGGLINASRLV